MLSDFSCLLKLKKQEFLKWLHLTCVGGSLMQVIWFWIYEITMKNEGWLHDPADGTLISNFYNAGMMAYLIFQKINQFCSVHFSMSCVGGSVYEINVLLV